MLLLSLLYPFVSVFRPEMLSQSLQDSLLSFVVLVLCQPVWHFSSLLPGTWNWTKPQGIEQLQCVVSPGILFQDSIFWNCVGLGSSPKSAVFPWFSLLSEGSPVYHEAGPQSSLKQKLLSAGL